MVVVVVVGARCDAFSTHQRQRAKSDKRERKMIKMLEEQEQEEEEENDRPSIDGVAGLNQAIVTAANRSRWPTRQNSVEHPQ